MRKFMTLAIMFVLLFTLSACGDDDVIADLTTTVENLQTQLNSSDLSIDDLEDSKTALQAEIDQLEADLLAAGTANDELEAELADLQAEIDEDVLGLVDSIGILQGQLADVSAEFDLALDEANAQIQELLDQLAVYEVPIMYGIEEYNLELFESLRPILKGYDIQDGDVTSSIMTSDPISFTEPGDYTILYTVEDSEGNVGEFEVLVHVELTDFVAANYLSGVDLSKLDAANKGRLFAALENYLIDNVFGGVPLYTGASRVMYADRVSLFSPQYNGVLGFGTAFSTLTVDDSNVLMYDDVAGNVDEFTWRSRFTTDHTSLNNWIADDSNSSDFIDLFTGSLYTFYFDASKTGYEINPDLASAEPVAMDPETINGRVYSDTWQIPIEDGLTWSYHPDTDLTNLPVGHEDLDANDYYETWKYALDNSWFRAISGGGDFITNGVKNVAAYVDGNADWADVGIKLIDDNTLELEFTSTKTAFDVKYSLVGNWTPVNLDLMTDLGALYAQGPDSVASSGIYQFLEYTPGQFYYFGKNAAHPNAALYNYTGQQFRYIETDEQAFEEFLAGRLESSSIPSARIDEFISDPRVEVAPANTTWRLQMNAFGTPENRDAYIAQYPEMGIDPDFEPEPILQYLEMRRALYYGFDRYEAAVNVVKTYLPAYTYFASTYFLDAEGGLSVRGTEAGAQTLETYGNGTYGYVPDAAVAYFRNAVAQAIEDGYYEPGTFTDPTIIELSLTYASSGNTGAQNMVAELEQQYEELLFDSVNYVGIDIVVADVEFPTNYYNFMMIGNTDLGIGGISGSLLDAPSFLDTFNDNNISGFTLNWGIDTHSVNIPVTYVGLDGESKSELWSYNALVAALNGKEYIQNGVQQTVFDSLDGLINAYVDMAGSTVAVTTDAADLAQYILGSTVEELATAEGYDAVHAKIVENAEGLELLYVIAEEDGGFELLEQASLYYDATTAIGQHSGYASRLLSVTGPIDDATLAADAYNIATNGYATIADLAADLGLPLAYVEVYVTEWDFGSDLYVVLHIGDYYIPMVWL